MSKTGWIIYNGNLKSNKFLDFAEMLQQAILKKNHQAFIYKNNDLLTYLSTNQLNLIHNEIESLPDFVIFTDKDLYLARQFELLHIPVFNSAKAIEISDDKIQTYQQLAKHQLPIPKTIIAPKVFVKEDDYLSINLDWIIENLKLPLIIKEAFGSFGQQVYFIRTREELKLKTKELQGKPFMFQEFISTSFGTDIRMQVVGDEVVAAMKRTAKDDFRANVTAGATMETYVPSKEEMEIAIQATKAIGADFAGVDLLFGPEGQPIICEINSNAHIRNLLECTGVNAADFIIEHAINVVHKGEQDEC